VKDQDAIAAKQYRRLEQLLFTSIPYFFSSTSVIIEDVTSNTYLPLYTVFVLFFTKSE